MKKQSEMLIYFALGVLIVPPIVIGTVIFATALLAWDAYWLVGPWNWFVADTFGIPSLNVWALS